MTRNFYYVLSFSATERNDEYLVLTEYDLYNPGRSLPDHPPPENLVKTHTRGGFQYDGWSVVEVVAGDLVPSWPLAFPLFREEVRS